MEFSFVTASGYPLTNFISRSRGRTRLMRFAPGRESGGTGEKRSVEGTATPMPGFVHLARNHHPNRCISARAMAVLRTNRQVFHPITAASRLARQLPFPVSMLWIKRSSAERIIR